MIVYGTYELILAEHEHTYTFTRTVGTERLLVVLNFSKETPVFTLPTDLPVARQELLISNYDVDPAEDMRWYPLRPFEARVYHLQ